MRWVNNPRSKAYRKLLKDFCARSSFAGLRFIADDSKHWIERVFWIILVVLSWYGSALLVISAYEAMRDNAVSFGMDTAYLDWNTKFLTVVVCESANVKKVYSVSNKLWPPGPNLDLEEALKEIAYFTGTCFLLKATCYDRPKPDPNCPMSNYSYYAYLVRHPCEKMIKNCSYNGQELHCCEYFLPLNTDMGICYALNSLQSETVHPYPMFLNRQKKRGVLSFELAVPAKVYTIGDVEVPSIASARSSYMVVQTGYLKSRRLSIKSMENDPLLLQTSISQRNCRMYHENDGGFYRHYSYSSCLVSCRKKYMLALCGCTDHFMIGAEESERCNLTGLVCINQLISNLTNLKPPWAHARPGMVCDCLPSCSDLEVNVVQDGSQKNPLLKKKAAVIIEIPQTPTEKLQRRVVRSQLDLVVSFGGSAGLFLGASLLSFVELIFYFTIRLIGNIWIERQHRRSLQY